MQKNHWIAILIIVIIFLCIAVSCILAGVAGIAGFVTFLPDFSWDDPFQEGEAGSPTPSPVVVRPSPGVQVTSISPPPAPSQPASPTHDFNASPPAQLVSTDTLHTLENTFIPINDPIKLGRRLLGLHDLSPTVPPPPAPLAVGTRDAFWVGNGDYENFSVQATLQAVTDHAYFWIQDNVRFSQADLDALADSFENQIYPTNREFFGSEWTPGVDGDPHIYILYARGVGEGIAGYYSSADEYPPRVNRFSNAHEMFVFNADNSPLDSSYTYGVLAHELQHMIHWYQDRNEANWLSEGFSELAVLLNDFYDGGFDALFVSDTDLQLNNWPDDTQGDSTPHYGASFLFVTYFLDRFGESATKALVDNQDNDLNSVDSTLRQLDATDPLTGQPIGADDFFLDWSITNYLMDPQVGDGRYDYTSYQGTPKAAVTQSYSRCPVEPVTTDVHQYGTDYIRFSCPGSYTLHFEGSIQVPLLLADPHSGGYALWSNKSDESDMLLTRTFDFTGHTGPLTLDYWTWYDIENGWDYVYLEASTDGENWFILTTPSCTDYDPQGNSYGCSYTGYSGGGSAPVWIHESVDMSMFAGHEVSLRFEYITDANVTGEGFLLDDVSISGIDYFEDFESGSAGWQAEGWARIRNVLPQNYRLALLLIGDTTRVHYLALEPDTSVEVPFTIGGDVDQAVLVVAATTRFTRQLALYRYSVTQP